MVAYNENQEWGLWPCDFGSFFFSVLDMNEVGGRGIEGAPVL